MLRFTQQTGSCFGRVSVARKHRLREDAKACEGRNRSMLKHFVYLYPGVPDSSTWCALPCLFMTFSHNPTLCREPYRSKNDHSRKRCCDRLRHDQQRLGVADQPSS